MPDQAWIGHPEGVVQGLARKKLRACVLFLKDQTSAGPPMYLQDSMNAVWLLHSHECLQEWKGHD